MNDFSSSKLGTYIGLSNYYRSENNYKEAITGLENGLHLSQSLPNAINRCSMLEKVAEIYEIRKDYKKALTYRKALETQKDSLIKHDNDLMIGDLHVKYETRIKEAELAGLQVRMKEKENSLKLLIIIICILISLSIAILLMYRRKNILYMTIVKQRKSAIKQEDILRAQIKEMTEIIDKNNVTSDRYSSSLTSEKSSELFNKLEKLMHEDKIFLDVDLTREKIAEALNTNRTYLSQIINEITGLNFSQYINNFRIEEAVRILSDQNNEMPLKAVCNHVGFRSMTTFYNLFQTSIGLTPAQFRSKNMIIETEKLSLKEREELL